jgi:hypothetical protein
MRYFDFGFHALGSNLFRYVLPASDLSYSLDLDFMSGRA